LKAFIFYALREFAEFLSAQALASSAKSAATAGITAGRPFK
jgi:hypothetical protein